MNEIKELLIALRGEKKPVDVLHPEEVGEWICNDCIKRIGYGEKAI